MSAKSLLAAGTAAAALTLAASADAGPVQHYHIFRATSFASLTKQPAPTGGDMNYYGGPVFSNVKVQTVIWNRHVRKRTQNGIPLFTAALVDSTYVDQLGEYDTAGVETTGGHKSTDQTIHRGTYLGQVVLNPHNKATTLTDGQIQAEIKRQLRKGVLAPSDDNTLYMIYFPANITILLDGQASCVVFGAYHFATIDTRRSKKHNVFYSVEPECNQGYDYLTFAASHEFAEATTDNVPTPLVNPAYPQAWNDDQAFEIGDKCSGSGRLKSLAGSWEVTQVFLNSLHGCSTTPVYTSP